MTRQSDRPFGCSGKSSLTGGGGSAAIRALRMHRCQSVGFAHAERLNYSSIQGQSGAALCLVTAPISRRGFFFGASLPDKPAELLVAALRRQLSRYFCCRASKLNRLNRG